MNRESFFVGCEWNLVNKPCVREFWGRNGEAQIVADKYSGKRKTPAFDKASLPHSALVVVEEGDYVVHVKRNPFDNMHVSIYAVGHVNYEDYMGRKVPHEIELKPVVSLHAKAAPTETHWELIAEQVEWRFAEKTGVQIGKAILFALRRAFGDEHSAPQDGAGEEVDISE